MKFERVSFQQFQRDLVKLIDKKYQEVPLAQKIWESLQKPQRADPGSAGYDFFSPFDFRLCPGDQIFIPTGFKVKLNPSYFLLGAPRSGQGSKYFIRLANTVAIVDPRHYGNPDNEGTIYFKLRNEFWGDEFRPNCCLNVLQGQAYAQGILVPYGLVEDDCPVSEEHLGGGFGSTDKIQKVNECEENNSGIVL
jgi:dUTP pyrophosphatase